MSRCCGLWRGRVRVVVELVCSAVGADVPTEAAYALAEPRGQNDVRPRCGQVLTDC